MIQDEQRLHVIFLPYMAPGHMMPMVDIARLVAAHGVRVTIITTTMNALRFQKSIDRDANSGRQITVEILRFPSTDAGLPEGCENLSATPTPEMSIKLYHGIDMLQPQMKKLLRESRPDCIVSDVLFHWTVDIASELGVPRLGFSGSGFFNLCVADSLERHEPHKNIESEEENFVLPGLPDAVELTRSQLPDIVKTRTEFSGLFDKLKEADRKSFGVLVNSFYDLEPAYADHYRNVVGNKAWQVGPVSLFNIDADDKAERGDKVSASKDSCLNWLDTKKPNTTIYICLGSLTRITKAQILEMASALEDSGHPFVWVVGKIQETDQSEDQDQQQEWWLPEGFEDRMRDSGQGFIITGWAPQVLVLEHPAIGGFLTHCGWNSILEGVCAGVPMVTWPIFAEQFYNEKLVTQVLKFGIPVGNEVWKVWATQVSPLISRDKIRRAVCAVMDAGNAAEEMRKIAGRLSQAAKEAVEEGGSSDKDMKNLIEEIKQYRQSKKCI